MPEKAKLIATCDECSYEWTLYGGTLQSIPRSEIVKCPKCGHQNQMEWADSEIRSLLMKKKHGLISDSDLTNKLQSQVELLEKRVEILEQSQKVHKEQIELQNQKTVQVESTTKAINEWAKKREQDFLDIEAIAEELNSEEHDKEKFRNSVGT